MCFVPISIYLSSFFFLFLLSTLFYACFRRSNKITSVCCRPTMTKDEKRDREGEREKKKKTSRADACYTTRQDDRKLYLILRALLLIVLDDRRYAQKSNGNREKKENMLPVYSSLVYNSIFIIIREKQQLHSIRLQTRNKRERERKRKARGRENIIINQR